MSSVTHLSLFSSSSNIHQLSYSFSPDVCSAWLVYSGLASFPLLVCSMISYTGNKGQLLPNSSEFNVDPNAPFLGGGVNPSSYEPSSPPARPSQFQRLASLKRFVSYTRPTRQTHPEDGNSDTTIDSPTPTPTSILPSSPPDPIRPFWSEHAPQPVQQPQYASSPVISPHTVLSPAGYPRYSPAQAPYNANNLRTPSSGHQSESTRNSYEETVPEQDLEDTLINHDSQFQPNATAPADMFEQSAVHIAADYAKMPEPPYPPHGTGRPSRMQTFWETLNNMPWVRFQSQVESLN